MSRYVHFASRLTGWNAIKSRAEQLGLGMTEAQIKAVTLKIKAMADVRPLAIDDADSIIRNFHFNLSADKEKELLPLSDKEKKIFQQKERELAQEKEKRAIDEQADAEAEVPVAKKQRTVEVSKHGLLN
ncbi:homocitrate synthase lys21 [Oleoguttula sp. CCFEE 5521]